MDSKQIVTFFLNSPDPRAWLVINGDREEPHVVEMWRGYANHWSASAWLRPGDYRCRYYCGDDTHATYCGPAQTNGQMSNEMDGLVSIERPKQRVSARPVKILLVDDNLTTLDACAKLLRGDGYTVHIADGYQTALTIAKHEKLDLAICDINLWDGDGCDLLNELKLLQPTKAIAITGYTLREETEHYRDAGFAVVLRKPFHHSEITSAIDQLCSPSNGELQHLSNASN